MTRIAFFADGHVGNHRRFPGAYKLGMNDRCREALGALAEGVRIANANDANAIVFLGDLLDGTTPNPQMIAAVQRAMEDGPPWYVLKGNHEEVSDLKGDHSLAPLYPVAEVVDEPDLVQVADDVALAMIPYRPGRAAEWLPGAFDELSKLPDDVVGIACVHLGIADADTPSYLENAHDSIDVSDLREQMERKGIAWAAAGNWHERKQWGGRTPDVVQVGTVCPTGFNNPGFDDYGWMAIWADDWPEPYGFGFRSFRVPGPRFAKVGSIEEYREALAQAEDSDGASLYVELIVEAAKVPGANEMIRADVEAGRLVAGGAFPDRAGDEERAREVAQIASSAEHLAEALVAHVERMKDAGELPPSVALAEVLEATRGYLER